MRLPTLLLLPAICSFSSAFYKNKTTLLQPQNNNLTFLACAFALMMCGEASGYFQSLAENLTREWRIFPVPLPGLVMVLSMATLYWKQHEAQFPFCRASPSWVHAFASVCPLTSHSHTESGVSSCIVGMCHLWSACRKPTTCCHLALPSDRLPASLYICAANCQKPLSKNHNNPVLFTSSLFGFQRGPIN